MVSACALVACLGVALVPAEFRPPEPDPDFEPTLKLTLKGAKKAMRAAERKRDEGGYKVSIAICDAGGITTLLTRNGDGHSGVEAMDKCKTAALFETETVNLEKAANVTDGTARTSLLSLPWVLLTGGLPMFKGANLVGAVGVSGIPGPLGVPIGMAAVDAVGASTTKK